MSTKKRIGVSTATSEAARRQLMQPVLCWEKTWAPSEYAAPGSNLKVYKWVRTEKHQQFSDDEGDLDEPLAPLPDEPDVVEVEEDTEMDQDESAAPPSTLAPDTAAQTPLTKSAEPSKPPSPTPAPSTSQLALDLNVPDALTEASGLSDGPDTLDSAVPLGDGLEPPDGLDPEAMLDQALNPMSMDALDAGDVDPVDLSGLPPDGIAFEGTHDLNQLDQTDAILGGPMMDQTGDPFAEPQV